MEGIKKAAITVFFVLSVAVSAFASDIELIRAINPFDTPPEPQLMEPGSDKVILTGKDFLEFRWRNSFVNIDHFIFKIYKGYNTYARDLIYKQSVPSNVSAFKIKSDLFENSQVYTWSLIQVSLSGRKSDKSVSSFKVIKK
jgi:hypothetical protein